MKNIVSQEVKSMLFEKRKIILQSTKDGMKTMRSGEVREILGPGFDEGDMAVITQIENMQSTLFGNQAYLIKSIDEALKRLNDGTYHICEACDNEIGEERLRAVPFTRHCRNCQEHYETLRRMATPSRHVL
ncbi:MAG: TraR/DksA family transcriptional regulator [Nitrospiraceae bacterium]|nr:MAG: TraR/DksA family transcriptional regulator [Nitrospiraceae bacterium]